MIERKKSEDKLRRNEGEKKKKKKKNRQIKKNRVKETKEKSVISLNQW